MQAAMQSGWGIARFLDEAGDGPTPLAGVPCENVADASPEAGVPGVVVGIGNPSVRRRIAAMMLSRGFSLPTVVHPTAYVAPDAELGAGTVVLAGAIVESGARIGDCVIIDVGSIVDHDATVGAFAHVRPGSVVTAYSTREAGSDDALDGAASR
jgi:UDP-3-O-[3-hydroxymyristoyl] glucosamine N-acyltransferase